MEMHSRYNNLSIGIIKPEIGGYILKKRIVVIIVQLKY